MAQGLLASAQRDPQPAHLMSTPGPMPEARGDRLVGSALALLTSNATGALLGLVFWALAAHLFPTKDVGYGVAEIAAMTGLASIAQLNLSVIFPRFLYAAGARAGAILRSGYAISMLVALVTGTVFVTLTGHHDYIDRGAFSAVFFVAALVLWVVFTIEDAALTGLRATVWVPVENTSFSLAKILLLPVFSIVAPLTGVFESWTLPVICCIIPVNYYLFRKVLPAHSVSSAGRGSIPPWRVVGSVLAGEYVGGLCFIALSAVPALLIVSKLGPVQTAYFQTPWLIGTSFDLLLYSIATSLIVEASARPEHAATLVPRAVRLACSLLIPGLVVLLVGAPVLLKVLGENYAMHGTSLLRCVALALPFMGVNVLYLTFARMARRVRRVVAMQVGLAVLVLTLTEVLIGRIGITGAGVAFAAGQAIMACLVFPSVVRQYRRADMVPSFAPGASLVARDAVATTLGQGEGE
jgi:O-antigen/teichoic acid export membrane protein